MAKRTKKAIRKNVKSINVKDNLIVHECAIKPYQIFCEWIDAEVNEFASDRTLLFEVVEIDEQYCFFEGFREVCLLRDRTEISIRRVDLSKAEIEQRAWSCLMNEFTNLDPINPKFFEVIKSSMPAQVQQALFNKPLTIQHILNIKGLRRHHYDYQTSLYRNQQPTKIPSFSELIGEVRYDNNN
ncbi:hypothetical protein [Psychrobacter piscatorii]|uniref:hypothetical protein n=1 Tax=Psychrobacter piscatorii TaxID=554343 RepID=UPI003736383E